MKDLKTFTDTFLVDLNPNTVILVRFSLEYSKQTLLEIFLLFRSRYVYPAL